MSMIDSVAFGRRSRRRWMNRSHLPIYFHQYWVMTARSIPYPNPAESHSSGLIGSRATDRFGLLLQPALADGSLSPQFPFWATKRDGMFRPAGLRPDSGTLGIAGCALFVLVGRKVGLLLARRRTVVQRPSLPVCGSTAVLAARRFVAEAPNSAVRGGFLA